MRLIILLLLLASSTANAGVNALTIHSRANCLGFNESITWHKGHLYQLETYSEHYLDGSFPAHTVEAPLALTWRSAAMHIGEGFINQWSVRGRHFMNYNHQSIWLGLTTATGCNPYDGWWD